MWGTRHFFTSELHIALKPPEFKKSENLFAWCRPKIQRPRRTPRPYVQKESPQAEACATNLALLTAVGAWCGAAHEQALSVLGERQILTHGTIRTIFGLIAVDSDLRALGQ